MSYTLVVIDLQPYFIKKLKDKSRVITNTTKLIYKAMAVGAQIIYLEYSYTLNGKSKTPHGYGRTTKSLTKHTIKYSNKSFVAKTEDSGGIELESVVVNKKVLFCGVNTDCCVKATISDFLYYVNDVEAFVDIEACDSSWDHIEGIKSLESISQYSNLKFL